VLQEFDHVALVENVTRYRDLSPAGEILRTEDVFTAASSPHRGPAFLDVPLDHSSTPRLWMLRPETQRRARQTRMT
jgi:thiamine pyrophosphate-dependent acetolactate synthase large subunit-like protein